MLTIDGAYGEGGGQILRTALSLAAVTNTSVRITNARARRKKPGLFPQHLMAIRALSVICEAHAEGAQLGSTEITFRPRTSPQPGHYIFDVAEAAEGGSAGSVALLLQTLLFPLSLTGDTSRLILKGGTHVAWSPTFDYMRDIYLPEVSSMGIAAECRLNSWGFYPNGGGEVEIDVGPSSSPLQPCRITERGDLQTIIGRAVASNLPSHIPQRMVNRASSLLEDHGLAARIKAERVTGAGPGAGIFLNSRYERARAGFSALGKPGKPSETVAEEACEAVLQHHQTGAPVDQHLADQLILPAALAEGTSTYRTCRITKHLLTNFHVIQRFLPASVQVDADEGQPGTITVNGAGLSPLT